MTNRNDNNDTRTYKKTNKTEQNKIKQTKQNNEEIPREEQSIEI